MRQAIIERKTAETNIFLSLNLDGTGKSQINSGCGFLDHMLTLFASHGKFDLTVKCTGDTQVDYHHTVEDIGIALGEAFFKALGDKKGICRYGEKVLVMDEALIDSELCEEFWFGFARKSESSLHIRSLAGKNTHHIIEGIFKACARAIRQAVAIDSAFANEIPSTKGVL